jgi:hypothetical protein
MPRLEFKPTILVFERAKTLHALDRAATVTGTITIQVENTPQVIQEAWLTAVDMFLTCEVSHSVSPDFNRRLKAMYLQWYEY